jgi:outer membrane immunogenic protein
MTSKLIKAGMTAAALMATPMVAQAADVPIRPVYKAMPRSVVAYYNWTGFYAGVHAGYGWGTSTWDFPAVTNSPKGSMFGLTAGYNMQAGSFVYGLELDYGWSTMKANVACFGAASSCETSNSYLGTVRGRIGYAFDRFLPYLTVGGAYGDIKARNTVLGSSASSSRFGLTYGGGLEYAFLSNWTAKIEYLHVDLGKFDCGVSCGLVTPDNVSFKADVVRLGLNYKFGGY